jgi:hypothetical protein
MDKVCKKCMTLKSVSDFRECKGKSGKIYRVGECEACIKERKRSYYHKNPDHHKELQRKRLSDPSVKVKRNSYYTEYRKKNRGQYLASMSKRQKIEQDSLSDNYVITTLVNEFKASRDTIRKIPGIIELKRLKIQLKRKIYASESKLRG